MNDPCPRCGAARHVEAAEGLCPTCSTNDTTGSYAPGMPGRWMPSMSETIADMPRVLLHDTRDGIDTPSLVMPASDEMPPKANRSARIQLLGEIARGGMGAILKGRDPDLGRDLAVKVLLDAHRDRPELVRRFIEEAQIGGQLQHPGIVPVYELGSFGDCRPYFTMKLVKGRTLAHLLADRQGKLDDVARFLGIFEQISQTVAYAHARGVIHRDLKPSNVMVGSFGEVQVMDWGLAKVLPKGGASDDAPAGIVPATETIIATARGGDDSDLSRAGSVMGTPSYMAPEQARGELGQVDERADVFALGSILCEILTGRPAFLGRNSGEIQRKAALGDTAEALERLDACRSDLTLIGLARHCLSREPEDRPRDAGEIAARVAGHLADVQRKLRDAERDRAVAQATAVEERKRRRLQAGLAAAILALATLGAVGYGLQSRQAHARASARAKVLGEAATLLRLARLEPEDQGGWQAATASVRQAEGAIGDDDPAAMTDLAKLQAEVVAGTEAAAGDKVLLDRLVDIRSAKADDPQGTATEAAYLEAFRKAGLDPDSPTSAEQAGRIKARSSGVSLAVASAMDDWAALRRGTLKNPDGARRLVEAARRLDPDPWRDGLRSALDQADPIKRKEALAALARSAGSDDLGAISLELLGKALTQAGEKTTAESVLRAAQRRYPGDVWVCYELAGLLDDLNRPDEAIRYYMAARSIRPETAHELAHALDKKGERDEALAVFRDLARVRPRNGRHLGCLGRLLKTAGLTDESDRRLDEAILALREAIRLDPAAASSMGLLASALEDREKFDEAVAACRSAIRLRPDSVLARRILSRVLAEQKHHAEALAEAREVVRLDPTSADSQVHLGLILQAIGQFDEAVAACREALRLQPDQVEAHNGLGIALGSRKEPGPAAAAFLAALRLRPGYAPAAENLVVALDEWSDPDAVVAAYREAIRLVPESLPFRINFAVALLKMGKPDEAAAAFAEAVRLKPDSAEPHSRFGAALCSEGRPVEAEVELRRAIQLDPAEPHAYLHLGHILKSKGRLDEAIAALREATRLDPVVAENHFALGDALDQRGRVDEAKAAYREAIRLRPAYAEPHNNLGVYLNAEGKTAEAVAEFREALRHKPDLGPALANLNDTLTPLDRFGEALDAYRGAVQARPGNADFHYHLGRALGARGDPDAAIVSYREAIRLDPELAVAHCNLAGCLRKKGDYAAALAEMRRGHELGSKIPGWGYPSARWLREAETLAALAARLPSVLKGEDRPKDGAEWVAFAVHCYDQGRHVASARLFAEALANYPGLLDDPTASHRYNAACASALAGSGPVRDDPPPDEAARARLRRQALDWLVDELAARAARLESSIQPEARAKLVTDLRHWQVDADLAGVRDPEALAKLPEAERPTWRDFWDRAAALLAKAERPGP